MSRTSPYLVRLASGGPDLIERARNQTLSLQVTSRTDGSPVAITAAGSSFTLYDAQGTEVVTAGAVTSTTLGQADYALGAATVPATKGLGDGWRGVWTLVIGSDTEVFTQDYALVRYAPHPAVTPEDLYARHNDLRDQVPSAQASVGWYPQIHEAWKEITQRLADQGRRPQLIVSAGSLRLCHLALTFGIIFGDLQTRLGDNRFGRLAEHYQRMFDTEWNKLRFQYDRDEDGKPDGQEAAQAVLYLDSAPRSGFASGVRYGGRGWR